jgi:hypothetical protein
MIMAVEWDYVCELWPSTGHVTSRIRCRSANLSTGTFGLVFWVICRHQSWYKWTFFGNFRRKCSSRPSQECERTEDVYYWSSHWRHSRCAASCVGGNWLWVSVASCLSNYGWQPQVACCCVRAPHREDVWRNGGNAAHVRNLGIRWEWIASRSGRLVLESGPAVQPVRMWWQRERFRIRNQTMVVRPVFRFVQDVLNSVPGYTRSPGRPANFWGPLQELNLGHRVIQISCSKFRCPLISTLPLTSCF